MLALKNLYKKYQRKDVWAVENVSLEVAQGELLALVGESGSGKTTLLRLIAGFEIPQQGLIYLKGREVFGPSHYVQPEKRRIGMVFQDYALFPHLKIRENITFGLKHGSKAEKENRLQEMLTLVDLQSQAAKYPHELSGGQQQRVALARALAPQPDLLLLDEPFSNLDEVLKEQMRREMRRIIKSSGTTAVFVTHDTRDALTTADRIVILKDGSMQQTGSPQEVYQHPVNRYVAGFFGQVNLLPAVYTNQGYQTAVGTIPAAHRPLQQPRVLLCLRPEHLEVCRKDEANFTGTVQEVTYLGSYNRIRILAGNESLLLHLASHVHVQTGDLLNCKINTVYLDDLPMIPID